MNRHRRTTRDRLDTDALTYRERADRRAAYAAAYGGGWRSALERADKGAQ